MLEIKAIIINWENIEYYCIPLPKKQKTDETTQTTQTTKPKRPYRRRKRIIKQDATYNKKYGIWLMNEEITKVHTAITINPGIKRPGLIGNTNINRGRIAAIIDTLKQQQKIGHPKNNRTLGYINIA